MTITVCLAGATGWAGSELSRGIAGTDDIVLAAAVSRTHAGKSVGDVLGDRRLTAPIYASAHEALTHACDVFIDYTHPDVAKDNVLAALEAGAHVVVGTSGLSDQDYAEIDAAARHTNRGALAAGNFALTAVLLLKFAVAAAKLIPQWEILDYAHDEKPDAPSGTTRELAARLEEARASVPTVSIEDTVGAIESRGATISSSQIHSIRLPGYALSAEVVFGMPDQRLAIRHDSGSSARPYVDGALLAIRKVSTFVGLKRGLDTILDV